MYLFLNEFYNIYKQKVIITHKNPQYCEIIITKEIRKLTSLCKS